MAKKTIQVLRQSAPVLVLAVIACQPARAAWSNDPDAGTAVAQGNFTEHGIAEDGLGGALLTYRTTSSANRDIYAQRVDSAGNPLWGSSGVVVCAAPNNQSFPAVVSDGAGGAIISWNDYRDGKWDVYAQRVTAAGAVAWAANGVPVYTMGSAGRPVIIADGTGGALVTWNGMGVVRAQRLDATGSSLWVANGVQVSLGIYSDDSPQLVGDGVGGAYITWTTPRVYIQHLDGTGAAQWTANGVIVCPATPLGGYGQRSPNITKVSGGGAVVAWFDNRSTVRNRDIYLQRYNASGAPQLAADGVLVYESIEYGYLGGSAIYPQLISGASGSTTVLWYDINSMGSAGTTFVQRLDAAGDRIWTSGGVPIASGVYRPNFASDNEDGCIVTWRNESTDVIYVQRFGNSGTALWTVPGVIVSSTSGTRPLIIADGSGGALISWHTAGTTYMSRVGPTGTLGAVTAVPDWLTVERQPLGNF